MLLEEEYIPYLKKSLEDHYGMRVDGNDPTLISALSLAMNRLPAALASACGIKLLGFEDLGESKEYYPNHGYYVGNKLILNTQLLTDDQVFLDKNGRALNRFEHTLFHEMGHGWDAANGTPSLKGAWTTLSGWSKESVPGLLRITIREEGAPDMEGDWYFDSQAGFPRFYAKRNPEEDFADCFAFYVGGLGGFLPANKTHYLDAALWRYWIV